MSTTPSPNRNNRLTIVWQGKTEVPNSSTPLEVEDIDYSNLLPRIKQHYDLNDTMMKDILLTNEKGDISIYTEFDLREATKRSNIIYIFDAENKLKKEMIRHYEQIKNTLPHYNVLASGSSYPQSAYVYRGSERVPSVDWALSEMIDNSISAIRSKRKMVPSFIDGRIHIHIMENSANKMSIVIYDNGKGMKGDRLVEWATMSLAPEVTGRDMEDASADVENNYVQVTASQYGVGSKHASFYCARGVYVITHALDTDDGNQVTGRVNEFQLLLDDMKAKYETTGNPYQHVLTTRPLAKAESSKAAKEVNQPVFTNMVENEDQLDSWTMMLLDNVYLPDRRATLRDPYMCNHLAYIYDHILNGPRGFMLEPERSKDPKNSVYAAPCIISVQYSNVSSPSKNWLVSDITKSTATPSYEFAKHRPPHVLRFEFQMVNLREPSSNKPVRVRGELFYMPKTVNGETHPDLKDIKVKYKASSSSRGGKRVQTTRLSAAAAPSTTNDVDANGVQVAETSNDTDDDDDDDDVSTAGENTPSSMFDIYWHGRLIPKAECRQLFFMEKALKQNPQCVKRIKGRLYVSVPYLTDQNKMQLRQAMQHELNDFGKHFGDSSMGGGEKNHAARVLYDDDVEGARRSRTNTIVDIAKAFDKVCSEWVKYDAQFRWPAQGYEKDLTLQKRKEGSKKNKRPINMLYNQVKISTGPNPEDHRLLQQGNDARILLKGGKFLKPLYFNRIGDNLTTTNEVGGVGDVYGYYLPLELYGQGPDKIIIKNLNHIDVSKSKDEELQEWQTYLSIALTKVPRIIIVVAENFDTTIKHHRVPAGFTLPGTAVVVQGKPGKNNKPSVIIGEIAVMTISRLSYHAPCSASTSATATSSSSSSGTSSQPHAQRSKRRSEQQQSQSLSGAKRLRAPNGTSFEGGESRRDSIPIESSDDEQHRSSSSDSVRSEDVIDEFESPVLSLKDAEQILSDIEKGGIEAISMTNRMKGFKDYNVAFKQVGTYKVEWKIKPQHKDRKELCRSIIIEVHANKPVRCALRTPDVDQHQLTAPLGGRIKQPIQLVLHDEYKNFVKPRDLELLAKTEGIVPAVKLILNDTTLKVSKYHLYPSREQQSFLIDNICIEPSLIRPDPTHQQIAPDLMNRFTDADSAIQTKLTVQLIDMDGHEQGSSSSSSSVRAGREENSIDIRVTTGQATSAIVEPNSSAIRIFNGGYIDRLRMQLADLYSLPAKPTSLSSRNDVVLSSTNMADFKPIEQPLNSKGFAEFRNVQIKVSADTIVQSESHVEAKLMFTYLIDNQVTVQNPYFLTINASTAPTKMIIIQTTDPTHLPSSDATTSTSIQSHVGQPVHLFVRFVTENNITQTPSALRAALKRVINETPDKSNHGEIYENVLKSTSIAVDGLEGTEEYTLKSLPDNGYLSNLRLPANVSLDAKSIFKLVVVDEYLSDRRQEHDQHEQLTRRGKKGRLRRRARKGDDTESEDDVYVNWDNTGEGNERTPRIQLLNPLSETIAIQPIFGQPVQWYLFVAHHTLSVDAEFKDSIQIRALDQYDNVVSPPRKYHLSSIPKLRIRNVATPNGNDNDESNNAIHIDVPAADATVDLYIDEEDWKPVYDESLDAYIVPTAVLMGKSGEYEFLIHSDPGNHTNSHNDSDRMDESSGLDIKASAGVVVRVLPGDVADMLVTLDHDRKQLWPSQRSALESDEADLSVSTHYKFHELKVDLIDGYKNIIPQSTKNSILATVTLTSGTLLHQRKDIPFFNIHPNRYESFAAYFNHVGNKAAILHIQQKKEDQIKPLSIPLNVGINTSIVKSVDADISVVDTKFPNFRECGTRLPKIIVRLMAGDKKTHVFKMLDSASWRLTCTTPDERTLEYDVAPILDEQHNCFIYNHTVVPQFQFTVVGTYRFECSYTEQRSDILELLPLHMSTITSPKLEIYANASKPVDLHLTATSLLHPAIRISETTTSASTSTPTSTSATGQQSIELGNAHIGFYDEWNNHVMFASIREDLKMAALKMKIKAMPINTISSSSSTSSLSPNELPLTVSAPIWNELNSTIIINRITAHVDNNTKEGEYRLLFTFDWREHPFLLTHSFILSNDALRIQRHNERVQREKQAREQQYEKLSRSREQTHSLLNKRTQLSDKFKELREEARELLSNLQKNGLKINMRVLTRSPAELTSQLREIQKHLNDLQSQQRTSRGGTSSSSSSGPMEDGHGASSGRKIFMDRPIGDAIKRGQLTLKNGYYGQVGDFLYAEDEDMAQLAGILIGPKLQMYVVHDRNCEAERRIAQISTEHPQHIIRTLAYIGLNPMVDVSVLPHEKIPHLKNTEFSGNPRFAVNCFKINTSNPTLRDIYAHVIHNATKYTLVMDTFDDAVKYRTAVTNAKRACPDILCVREMTLLSKDNVKTHGKRGKFPGVDELRNKGMCIAIKENDTRKTFFSDTLKQVNTLIHDATTLSDELQRVERELQQASTR